MKFNILKRAFSLTELLIVLVIVAVLFAAMLPMVTKRGRGETTANEPVWMFVKDDPQKSAYFDPGSSSLTSSAYVGFDPKGHSESVKPYSKMILKAKELQNMIQFRIGNDGDGTLAGVFTVTPDSMVMGSKMLGNADNTNNNNSLVQNGHYNTVLGMNSGSKLDKGEQSVAVGASSSMGGLSGSSFYDTVAVGANSNLYAKSKKSVLLGSNVGKTESASAIENTVAIGANSLGLPTSSGKDNVLLGYGVGATGINSGASLNVILNSDYYGTTPKETTIVGYNTFEGGDPIAKNLTAIGYNACSSFSNRDVLEKGVNGTTTCIGYNSAANFGYNDATKNLKWEKDNYEHIFLGGKPNGGFGGRSTFEIHNMVPKTSYSKGLNDVYPKNVSPTVVLNSHLVIRGNLYIPNSQDGIVSAFPQYSPILQKSLNSMEQGSDVCRKKCGLFHRRRSYHRRGCANFFEILGAIAGLLVSIGAFIATGGIAAVGLAIAIAVVSQAGYLLSGIWLGNALDGGKDFKRQVDAYSKVGLYHGYDADNKMNAMKCSPTHDDAAYPEAHYDNNGNAAYICPNVLRTSDIRLKAGISENTDAIAKILQVQPYHFTFKNDVNKVPQVGVMAQDLEKYFPTSVFDGLDGYKNIRWDEMFFATINSIKSLDESVNKYSSELVIMESDVKDITKDQKTIKNKIKNINDRLTKLENE